MALTSDIESTDSYTPQQLITAFNNLLVDQAAQGNDTSVYDVTGTTWQDVSVNVSKTVNVSSDDIVLLCAAYGYSIDDTSSIGNFRFAENGVSLTADQEHRVGPVDTARTTGYSERGAHSFLVLSPATGSVTYSLQFRVASGGGTLYSSRLTFNVVVLRAS